MFPIQILRLEDEPAGGPEVPVHQGGQHGRGGSLACPGLPQHDQPGGGSPLQTRVPLYRCARDGDGGRVFPNLLRVTVLVMSGDTDPELTRRSSRLDHRVPRLVGRCRPDRKERGGRGLRCGHGAGAACDGRQSGVDGSSVR